MIISLSGTDAAITAKTECRIAIIGGEQIYRLALEHVNCLYITRVKAVVEGDAFFPEFNQSQWRIADKSEHFSDERNPYDYTVECWVKN